jgi:peptidoglycan/xylan/chitin deacetylase (PgdA/CDA1 family)
MKATALLLLALLVAPSPAQLVYQGSSKDRLVALTFDAGADRGYASRILAVLERAGIHGTFGMTGKWALANRDLVRRMARDHDAFINHTFDHRSFTGLSTSSAPLSQQQRTWEIVRTEHIVHALTGQSTKPYFRPPYGDFDTATLLLARHLGYRYVVMWTLDSLGWEHLSAPSIVQRCVARARPGTIILMHVGIQSQDALALPSVISQLRRRGYRFATVPQIIRAH